MKLSFLPIKRNSATGGSEVLWAKVALRALARGYLVNVFPYKFKELHVDLHEMNKEGAKVFYRPTRKAGDSKLKLIWLKLYFTFTDVFGKDDRYLKQLAQNKNDLLVVSQGSWSDLAYDKTLWSLIRKYDLTFVIICHNFYDTGLLARKEREQISEMYSSAKHVFFVGKRQKQVVEKLLMKSIPNSSITLNPLNVSLKNMTLEYPRANGALKLAMVGSLDTKRKGHDLLFETLSTSSWKQRSWHLEIYGSGADEDNLVRLIGFYGLEHKVTLMGHTNDVESIWQRNEVLVMPSRIEAAPLTLYEAMLCGRPAVVTNIGDMGLVIRHGIDGFMAEAPHPHSLNKALEELWVQKEELEAMGRRAYEGVKDKFRVCPSVAFLDKLEEIV